MSALPETTITLILRRQAIPRPLLLLTQKCRLRVATGCSLKQLLCEQLQIDAAYLEDRIQTIFLDGKAVDEIETTVVRPGCTVALSAAMPGLAGATLRRGGYYAGLRRQISHHEENGVCRVGEGTITLKLFNLLITEIGPQVLRHGILMEAGALAAFWDQRPAAFFEAFDRAMVNDQAVLPETLSADAGDAADLVLQVMAGE
jgi:hypothetical protein